MLSTLAARAPDAALAFAGAVVHFGLAAVWAWFAVIATRKLSGRSAVAATLVVLVAWLLSAWVFPPALRALTADLSFAQQLFYHGVLLVTLWGGIRLAQSRT